MLRRLGADAQAAPTPQASPSRLQEVAIKSPERLTFVDLLHPRVHGDDATRVSPPVVSVGRGHYRRRPRSSRRALAGVIEHLGLGRADLLGYSLGAGASLRTAIQHPERVRRLALVSIPFRRDGWFPEVLAAMSQLSSAGFEQMKQSLMYQAWSALAPDVDAFPALMDKTGDLLRRPYDWTEEIKLAIKPSP
jgi:pimeloyl-ACP methyl ester carboxylesterase